MSLVRSELVGLPRRGSHSAFAPNWDRRFPRWVCLVVLGWLACVAGVYPAANAQTNTSSPALPANRYLLLVETSHAMQSRGPGILQTVQDLFGSGLKGQMHVGDTLGVWTFNSKLSAGQFPLQDWLARGQGTVIVRVVNFLKAQPYERKANFDKAWPELAQLIQDSPFLTIVLISSGETEIHGTPFDAPINQYYRTWRDQQQQAQMPFVTVLRAKEGKITHHAVAAAPWSLELPPLPPELVPPPAVAKPAAPPQTQPVMAAPLILSGKKPAPAPAPKPAEFVAPEPLPAKGSVSISTNPPETRLAAPDEELPSQTNHAPKSMARLTEPTPSVAAPSQTAAPEPTPPPAPPVPAVSQAQRMAEPPVSLAQPAAAPVAVANSAPGFFHRPGVWVGSLLLIGAFAGLGFWARRSRPPAHVSLITQSLERHKR